MGCSVLYWRIFHRLHIRVFSGLASEMARKAEMSGKFA